MANVRVAVRVRPLSGREVDAGARNIVSTHGNSLSITNVKVEGSFEFGDSRERVKHFAFDYCYDSAVDRSDNAEYASQELVYQDLGTEVLQAAFDGYNACLFAYGQTGTGKTFTMMGHPGEVGLTPRICEGLFSHVDDYPEESITFKVEISYMEIYNERVRDLLRTTSHSDRYTLRVREHPKDGPYVQDLSRHLVKDYDEVQTLLDRGNHLRTTAGTHMHEHSSRSHAIVTLNFTQAKLEDELPSETVSKVHLVDLAGSERADPNYHEDYKGRITEGANINKSLNTLGNVIKALAEKSLLAWSSETMGSNQSFASFGEQRVGSPQGGGRKSRPFYIPYRDSVLTWLLKDSLGGNSKTLMIATITPASRYYNETISTLRYAQRAKSIINKPRINEDANVSLIRQLRQEIERLKQMLESARASHSPQLNEIMYLLPGMDRLLTYHSDMESDEGGAVAAEQDSGTLLTEKLKENEAIANQLTQTWLNKWSETQTLMKDTDLSIRGLGRRSSSYGVIIDSQLPHLIGMDDDILSTGVIIFHLKEGKTLIGREDARREQDIVLDGPGIRSEHCHMKNKDGQVVIFPHHGAQCKVNGVVIHEPTPLTQGDVLVLGKTSMYRFNNPAQAAKLRQHRQHLLSASLQDGELSAASSVTSLSDTEAARAVPLRMFNPKLDSAQICLELERTYANEDERIEHARKELERVRAEVSVRAEAGQEEEERLWTQHERHRQELEAEKIRLARLRDRLLKWQEEAQEALLQQQQQLQQEAQQQKEALRQQLEQLTQNKGGDCTGQQTDPLHRASSSIQTGHGAATVATATDTAAVAVTGTVGQEIRNRKLSLEGKVKGLAQKELLHSFSHQQAVQELQERQQQMEEEMLQSQEEVESRMQQIQEKEEQYRDADATRLDHIRQQNEQLEALQRQEEQLELYLEEKQDLLAVGRAQPRPLRGACSELTLAPSHTPTAAFGAGAVRAASEANIGDCGMEAVLMDRTPSDSAMSESRESLEDGSELHQSSGFLPAGGPGRSHSLDSSVQSGSVEMLQDEPLDLSRSVGSEMGSDDSASRSMELPDFSDPSGSSRRGGEGRGRSRVRSGRGKPGSLQGQGQGQGKPETAEEKRLTARAAEVTARLYQSRSARSHQPDKPPARKSPSPQPSSKSRSPLTPAAARRGGGEAPEAPKRRNREEWERPWRTKPVQLHRSRDSVDQRSPSYESPDKNRDSWDRPWRQGRPVPDTDSRTRPSPGAGSPAAAGRRAGPDRGAAATDADRAGTRRAQPRAEAKGEKDDTGARGREDERRSDRGGRRAGPTPKTSPTSRRGAATKRPPSRDGAGPLKAGSKDVTPKDRREAGDSLHRHLPGGFGSEEELRSSRALGPCPRGRELGGSEGSLLTAPHRQHRPRTRSLLRQISSASSLPSVPEAAAESEADLDPAPLTYNPDMAALVAAVPRRPRRGRARGLLEEEEGRRHSEPVGEKLAQALEQYTAEMEGGMGRDAALHRADRLSPDSSLSETAVAACDIPQIHLIEASSTSTESGSSQESFHPQQSSDPSDAPGNDDLEVTPRPAQPVDSDRRDDDWPGAVWVDSDGDERVAEAGVAEPATPRAGDKREHDEWRGPGSPAEEVAKRKREEKQNDVNTVPDEGQSGALPDTGGGQLGRGADSVRTLATASGLDSEVSESDVIDEQADVRHKDSEGSGSYSADSLDDGESGVSAALPQHRAGRGDPAHLPIQHVRSAASVSGPDSVEEDSGWMSLHGDLAVDNAWPVPLGPAGKASESSGSVRGSNLPRPRSDAADGVEDRAAVPEGAPATATAVGGAGLPLQPTEADGSSDGRQSVGCAGSRARGLDPQTFPHTHSQTPRHIPPQSLLDSHAADTWSVSSAGPIPRDRESAGSPHSGASAQAAVRSEGGRETSLSRERTCEDGAVSQTPPESDTGVRPTAVQAASAGDVTVDVAACGVADGDVAVSVSGREVPVSMEMLTLLAEEEGSQLSDEASSSHVEQQIQVLQEVLQQLSPRASAAAAQTGTISSATHASNGRRGKRRQHTRHLKGSDSDNAEHFSDDSLASGANSRSSSRPSSGSRRRRRPANRCSDTAVKKRRGHSSEEYVTSDNDSIFSDDSLTHSSERHDPSAAQISDLRSSIQRLTADLHVGVTSTGGDAAQEAESLEGDVEGDAMAEANQTSVPALVSYFESQLSRPQGEAGRREQSPGDGERRQQRESSLTSAHSDDGNTSASESTQTEGMSVVMGKAPVSIHSTGDPNFTVPDGFFQAMGGAQPVHEESGMRAHLHRSWKLSITPTVTWHSPTQPAVQAQAPDPLQRRRKSETDPLASPEKRQRQDRLKDLHSKYGLTDEVDHLSDQDEDRGAAAATSGQVAGCEGYPVESASSLHRKTHATQRDKDGRLRFEVTINQDETSVLYNVEKTEYKTYTLRDGEDTVTEEAASNPVPDTININLTETTTLQREDRFETVIKERVIFDGSGRERGQDGDVILLEHTFFGGHVLDVEQEREGGDVSRESSVERHLTDEDSASNLKIQGSPDSGSLAPRAASESSARRTEAGPQSAVSRGQPGQPSATRSGASPPAVAAQGTVVHKKDSGQQPRPGADQSGDALDRESVEESELLWDPDRREWWSVDRRCSDSSSPGPRSPSVWPAGPLSDQTCDSDVPADSGITEVSTSESMASHDEDGADSTMSSGATAAAGHNNAEDAARSAGGIPTRVTVRREDLSNTFRMNESGVVAGQLHQTVAMHQDLPAQEVTRATDSAPVAPIAPTAGAGQPSAQSPLHASPLVRTHLWVEEVPPDTRPPATGGQQQAVPSDGEAASVLHASGPAPRESSPRLLPDGTLLIPVTVISPQSAADATDSGADAGGGPQSRDGSSVQVVEPPVVHLHGQPVSLPQRAAGSRDVEIETATPSLIETATPSLIETATPSLQSGDEQELEFAPESTNRPEDGSCRADRTGQSGARGADQGEVTLPAGVHREAAGDWAVSGPGAFQTTTGGAESADATRQPSPTDRDMEPGSQERRADGRSLEGGDVRGGGDGGAQFVPADAWLSAGPAPAGGADEGWRDTNTVPASQWLHLDFAQQSSEQPLAMSTAVSHLTPTQQAAQVRGDRLDTQGRAQGGQLDTQGRAQGGQLDTQGRAQGGQLDTQGRVGQREKPSGAPTARQSPGTGPAEPASDGSESKVVRSQHPDGQAGGQPDRTSLVESAVAANPLPVDSEPSATVTAGNAVVVCSVVPGESEDMADRTGGRGDEVRRPDGRPYVGEVLLGRVEWLPPTPVEHGSQSALVDPVCHDGLLLFSASSCREEPYAWVDTFREETGLASIVTTPTRRGRLASEAAAEALLAEVKRRQSGDPDMDEEELFFEESFVMSGQQFCPMGVSGSGGERVQEGLVSSAEDSFHSTESWQGRGRAAQRLLRDSSLERSLSANGQNDDLTASSEASVEFYTPTSLSDELADGRPGFASTPLSHDVGPGFASTPLSHDVGPGFASTPLSHASAAQSPVPPSSDSTFPNSQSAAGRLSLQSDTSSCKSADVFYSPDVTAQSSSGSAESSVYRTPQQSPRGRSAINATLASSGLPADLPSGLPSDLPSDLPSGLPPDLPSGLPSDLPGPGASRSPPLPAAGRGGDGGDSDEVEGQTNVLTAVAAAVGRQLVGDAAEMEAMREVLKQEVERKLARLQRRVRSLSDSAISSDFTETESTSVSPRNSRLPVTDGKTEGVGPDLAFYNAAIAHSPQEVFLARREDAEGPRLLPYPSGKRREGQQGKSLEDSGNIHDDQWQDTCTGLQEEERGPSGDTPGVKQTHSGETAAPRMSPRGVGDATSAQLAAGAAVKPQQGAGHADQSTLSQEGRAGSASQSERRAVPLSPESTCHTPALVSEPGDAVSPTRQAFPELTRLPGRFPERVVDAILSVQQSWPAAAFASHSRSLRKRRGLLGRKTKSLSSLADLAAAQERSDLEENLLEQARLIMQVARVPSGLDLSTGGPAGGGFANAAGEETGYDQEALAVDWVDGHFHPAKSGQALLVSRHPPTPAEGVSHAWLVSAERGRAQTVGEDALSRDERLSVRSGPLPADLVRSLSEQAAGQAVRASVGGRMQAMLTDGSGPRPPPVPQRADPDAESVTSITSVYGSSTAPSVSELSDASYGQTEGGLHYHHPELLSADVDSDRLLSDDRLLSSGELEVAAINARAAVIRSRPHTDTESAERALSPGEEILADILARQTAVASPTTDNRAGDRSSARRLDQPRIRGSSPRRCPPSGPDGGVSPQELLLPRETVQRLQRAGLGLDDGEAVEDLLQTGACEDLESDGLSAGQRRMLLTKALSTSNLARGRCLSEGDERQSLAWPMDRPASLACLEGLVLEESSEDGGSSADSICFVFMGRKGPEAAARLRALGGSISTSEGSEHMIAHSRSTESIPFEREGFVPPLSEHSASLGNIYTAAATSVQRKKQLHRSRSASLLDVATTSVSDDEPDENIFPPRVYAESEASWEGAGTVYVEDELSSHGTASEPDSARTGVSVDASTITITITNPAFVRRASLVEPSSEQHLSMTSPTQLYTSGSTTCVENHARQRADDAGGLYEIGEGGAVPQRAAAIAEVESGQPYFKFRSPGARPQQADSGAQTDAGPFQAGGFLGALHAATGTEPHPARGTGPLRRSQSTGSLETLTLVSPSPGGGWESGERTRRLPLSPSSERWMELSHLMLETTHILHNLQQTFPLTASPRSSAGSRVSVSSPRAAFLSPRTLRESAATQTEPVAGSWSAAGPPEVDLGHRLDTGTQTPTLPSEQYPPQAFVSGYPSFGVPLEPHTIVIKVKDALTQTTSSLGDLSSAETQTDIALMDWQVAGGVEGSPRPGMKDASSNVEGMDLADTTSQTDESLAEASVRRLTRDASSSVESVKPQDSVSQTDVLPGGALIQKETKDASSSYDKLDVSDSTSQTDAESGAGQRLQGMKDASSSVESLQTSETTSQTDRAPEVKKMRDASSSVESLRMSDTSQTEQIHGESAVQEATDTPRSRLERLELSEIKCQTELFPEKKALLKDTRSASSSVESVLTSDRTNQTEDGLPASSAEGVLTSDRTNQTEDGLPASSAEGVLTSDRTSQTEADLPARRQTRNRSSGADTDLSESRSQTDLDTLSDRSHPKAREGVTAEEGEQNTAETDGQGGRLMNSLLQRETLNGAANKQVVDVPCQTEDNGLSDKELRAPATDGENKLFADSLCQTDEEPALQDGSTVGRTANGQRPQKTPQTTTAIPHTDIASPDATLDAREDSRRGRVRGEMAESVCQTDAFPYAGSQESHSGLETKHVTSATRQTEAYPQTLAALRTPGGEGAGSPRPEAGDAAFRLPPQQSPTDNDTLADASAVHLRASGDSSAAYDEVDVDDMDTAAAAPQRRQVSVCTQMSVDVHPRYIAVREAGEVTSVRAGSGSESSQDRGSLRESVDSGSSEDDVSGELNAGGQQRVQRLSEDTPQTPSSQQRRAGRGLSPDEPLSPSEGRGQPAGLQDGQNRKARSGTDRSADAAPSHVPSPRGPPDSSLSHWVLSGPGVFVDNVQRSAGHDDGRRRPVAGGESKQTALSQQTPASRKVPEGSPRLPEKRKPVFTNTQTLPGGEENPRSPQTGQSEEHTALGEKPVPSLTEAQESDSPGRASVRNAEPEVPEDGLMSALSSRGEDSWCSSRRSKGRKGRADPSGGSAASAPTASAAAGRDSVRWSGASAASRLDQPDFVPSADPYSRAVPPGADRNSQYESTEPASALDSSSRDGATAPRLPGREESSAVQALLTQPSPAALRGAEDTDRLLAKVTAVSQRLRGGQDETAHSPRSAGQQGSHTSQGSRSGEGEGLTDSVRALRATAGRGAERRARQQSEEEEPEAGGELSFRRSETVKESAEVLRLDRVMHLESGPTVVVPPRSPRRQDTSHVGTGPDGVTSHVGTGPDGVTSHVGTGPDGADAGLESSPSGRRRGHGGELSYRLDESVEGLSRSRLTVPGQWGNVHHDSSFSDDDLFSSEAHHRAAWRARAGDYGLTPSPTPSDGSDRLSPALFAAETGRRRGDGLRADFVELASPQSADIMNEIEKLRQEHNRMMQLLERSRHRSSPFLSQLQRARSASPTMTHAGSGSSSSGSPVTVIAGKGSVRGSPVTFTATRNSPVPHSGAASGLREESVTSPRWTQGAVSDAAFKRHGIASSAEDGTLRGLTGDTGLPASSASTGSGRQLATSTSLPAGPAPTTGRTRSLDRAVDTPYSRGSGTESMPRPQAVYGGALTRGGISAGETGQVLATSAEASATSQSQQLLRASTVQLAEPPGWPRDVTDSPRTVPALSLNRLSPRQHPPSSAVSSGKQTAESSAAVSPRWAGSPLSRTEGLELGQPPLDTRHVSSTTGSLPSYSTASGRQRSVAITVDSPRDLRQRLHDQDRVTIRIVSDFSDDIEAPPTPREWYGDDDMAPDILVRTPRSLGGDNVPPLDHQLLNGRGAEDMVDSFLRHMEDTALDVLVKTPRSLGGDGVPPLDHLLPPSHVSTGVEATVDSSDDFTQTDAEDEGSLHLSQLDVSRGSLGSSGNSQTRHIRAELDRLHRERVEIIELLSLQYLPSSLTVELLEAKLNYCLGQTDMLLASLEKAWSADDPLDTAPRRHQSRHHEEYLAWYRQQFEQSRRDLRVCMEEARRVQNGTRGRRMARTRDVIAVQRRAEIEAFKQERRREQALFDRHRNVSPGLSDLSSGTAHDSGDLTPVFAPRFMTPRQHKDHLVTLRRSLVAASTEELNKLRERSRSSSVSPSPDRSVSPASSLPSVRLSRDSSLNSSLSPERGSVTASTLPAAYSTPDLRSNASPQRVPRVVLPPSVPSPRRGHSFPRDRRFDPAPRSSSLGPPAPPTPVLDRHRLTPPHSHLAPPRDQSAPCADGSLDPEQLLRESYAARQLNRQQISKAQEALRLLEEHRHGFHSHMRSQASRAQRPGPRLSVPSHSEPSAAFSEQAIQREIDNLQQQRLQSPGGSTGLDSGVMSMSLQESVGSNAPPDSTSTPRSSDSFAAYARDILVRNERHIQTIIARSNTTSDDLRDQDPSFDPSEWSLSETPSSLQSTDLDSFLNSSTSSLARSTHTFASSRPISSQDIKARIARRMLEKSKAKTSQK